MANEPQDDWPTVAERHHWRLRAVEERVSALAAPRRGWLDEELTEPAVQVALRDLVRGGDCLFDVGANFGGLTMLMSRLAGPHGRVCAFEANPEIARDCQQFLVNSGCGNVQLYNNAIYHTSFEPLSLFLSANRVSDSLYNKVSDRTVTVLSLSLDDFVEQAQAAPALVKMDIEGAEYDALVGFERTIGRHRPLLILEQQLADPRCLDWLQARDYIPVDLYEFVALDSFADLRRGTEATDVLYLPRERIADTPYQPPFVFEPVTDLLAGDFHWLDEHVFLSRELLPLRRGRYRIFADFAAVDPTTELKVGLAAGQRPLMRYHGASGWLAQTGRHWVFDAPSDMAVSVFFDFPGIVDPSFAVNRISVERLPQFDAVPRRAWT